MQLQIEHFGQCPTQLLTVAHPPRGRTIRVPRPLYLTFLGQHAHLQHPSQYAGISDLAFIHSHAPGLGPLVRLGFDPLRAIETLEKEDDLKQCANELALGAIRIKALNFQTKRVQYVVILEEKKAIVSMRCLFDSIECVDASGNLYSFPLERLPLHENNPIPLKIHPSAMPVSNRCCVTVPSYSYIEDSISSDLPQNIVTISRTSAWSSGGYILAAGGLSWKCRFLGHRTDRSRCTICGGLLEY